MTERYERWMQDPDAKQILESFNAAHLTAEQQDTFEELVDTRGEMGHSAYKARIKKLSGAIERPTTMTRFLINNFKASIRDRDIFPNYATDPRIAEGVYVPTKFVVQRTNNPPRPFPRRR